MEDTIAAVSTPPGSAGIGIIRMSGPESLTILDKVFRPKNPEKERKSHTIHYGHIVESSRIIDEVLVSVMKAPHTYTREDIAEINCHGGPVVLQKVMKLLLENGARLAAAGEFTKRAFLNGRLDLSQAEAVMDMISAKTERELAGFAAHLSGELKKRVTALREKMIQLLANIEVGIDYPEYEFETLEQPAMIAGIKDILEEVETLSATYENGRLIKDGIRTAIIGKPNVGKSSILNALLRANRAIVTDIAGTTRDTLEEYYYLNGLTLKLIDTAGIRKKGRVFESTEKYSVLRALRAIERSDIVCVVLNAEEGIQEQDKKIAGYAHEAGKGVVILVNKWDTLEKDNSTYKEFEDKIRQEFLYLSYAPIIFVSAKTKQRLSKIPPILKEIHEVRSRRISSSVLNDVLMDAIAMNPTPTDKGNRLKIYYMTQVAIQPPTFVTFVNDVELMHFSYERFLENRIRSAFGFEGTPIHMITRQRK